MVRGHVRLVGYGLEPIAAHLRRSHRTFHSILRGARESSAEK